MVGSGRVRNIGSACSSDPDLTSIHHLRLSATVADPGIFNGGGAAEDEAPKGPRWVGWGEGVKNFEFGALKCRILVQSGRYYKLV